MKRLFMPVLFCMCLAGCGPREIGQGSSSYVPPAAGGQPTAELMRYPVTGSSRTQQMLFHTNRPEVMEMTQKIIQSEYQRRMGLQPSPEDPAYRETPRERSPFRQ